MAKGTTLQELYDSLYLEAVCRARVKGESLPTEIDIFKVLHKEIKHAIERGDETAEALDELSEVQSFYIREQEESKRKDEVDRALREGIILDLDVLMK